MDPTSLEQHQKVF